MPKARTKKNYSIHNGYIYENSKPLHRLVWEQHNGPIPNGMLIHHADENKQNNAIGNLQMVDMATHLKIHSGCELRDGVWYKPCKRCKEFKNEQTEFHHWKQVCYLCKKCKTETSSPRYLKKRTKIKQENGKGSFIFYIDGNVRNLNPDNTLVVDKFDYDLLIYGAKKIDGVWYKPCNKCKELKEMNTEFNKLRGASGEHSCRCKKCHNELRREAARKAREASQSPDTIPIGGP